MEITKSIKEENINTDNTNHKNDEEILNTIKKTY